MHTAEQTVLAYTDALYAQRFDIAASFLYPGDLERMRLVILNCSIALASFGEKDRIVSAMGIPFDALSDSESFGTHMLAGLARRIQILLPKFGTVEQEILEIQETGDAATLTLRTRIMPREGADHRLHEYLILHGTKDQKHELQRIGDRWYVMLGNGFGDHVGRVRNEINEFNHRAGMDLPGIPPENELRSFRVHGFRETSGRTVIAPRFSAAKDFSEGLAAVRFFSLWGYIKPSGKTGIEPRFSDASDFSEGLAAAAIQDENLDDAWGYIDHSGSWLIEPIFESARDFREGRAAVRRENKWGYVDSSGILLIAHQYVSAQDFEDGVAEVLDTDGETHFIDSNGNLVESDPDSDTSVM